MILILIPFTQASYKTLHFCSLNLQNVIPMWKELENYKDYQNKLRAYLGNKKANEILSEALYLVSLGTNDFLENYYIFPTRRTQFTVQEYEDFLVGLCGNFIRELYGLGVRKISLTGVPPMGCLPLERTTNIMGQNGCMEEFNNVALEFNGKLKALARRLNTELRGLRMVFADAYHIFHRIIRKPSLYGEFMISCHPLFMTSDFIFKSTLYLAFKKRKHTASLLAIV